MEKSRSFPQYSSSYSGGEFRCMDEYSNSYSFNGPSDKGPSSSDPEIKRKKRVASYNFFTMEGKLKSSVRGSFKWIKTKVSEIRYGDWTCTIHLSDHPSILFSTSTTTISVTKALLTALSWKLKSHFSFWVSLFWSISLQFSKSMVVATTFFFLLDGSSSSTY